MDKYSQAKTRALSIFYLPIIKKTWNTSLNK